MSKMTYTSFVSVMV